MADNSTVAQQTAATNRGQFYCASCNMYFHDTLALQSHLIGKKHQQRLAQLQAEEETGLKGEAAMRIKKGITANQPAGPVKSTAAVVAEIRKLIERKRQEKGDRCVLAPAPPPPVDHGSEGMKKKHRAEKNSLPLFRSSDDEGDIK